jgi:hypothetical protein
MTAKLLPDEISKQMKNIYNNTRDYRGYCLDKTICQNVCCTDDTQMSCVEFAYMIDFLNASFPEQKVKEILTRERRRPKKMHVDLSEELGLSGEPYYCKILDDDGCLGYPARPFRCRGYLRDEKRGLCRPQGSVEIDNKSWRRIWRLDDSVAIPKRAERENDLDFWIKEILEY